MLRNQKNAEYQMVRVLQAFFARPLHAMYAGVYVLVDGMVQRIRYLAVSEFL